MDTIIWSQRKPVRDGGKHSGKSRILILQIVFVVMAAALLKHLWKLQVVEGEGYADAFKLRTTKTIVENGARGNIYD